VQTTTFFHASKRSRGNLKLNQAWVAVALLLPLLVWYGNPAVALLAGTVLSLSWRKPLAVNGHRWGRMALQSAIVLLGFTLSIGRVAEVSGDSLGLVAVYVIGVLGAGLGLARALRLERESGWLMTSGTAICGGTAIATLAPLVGARADQVGVAIGIVFLLNAAALFGFPVLGHWIGMSQIQFGMWAALAIHDTSSVLATAAIYGNEALEVATTVKLGRTLWLIPLALMVSLAQRASAARVRVPPFIVAFIAVSVLSTALPLPAWVGHSAGRISKALLVTALFFIGTEISWATLKLMRGRVLVHALLLWAVAGSATLLAVLTVFRPD
jgi:uncharacterized integral membrane protein (TIGR00698 family)